MQSHVDFCTTFLFQTARFKLNVLQRQKIWQNNTKVKNTSTPEDNTESGHRKLVNAISK